MQSTPPGEPSLFDDPEMYDILCHGLDYGIDFYVGLGQQGGRCLTSLAAPAASSCRSCKPGRTPTGWTSSSPCSTLRGERPPLWGYRRPSTAATWPISNCCARLCPDHDYLQRLLPHADDRGPTPAASDAFVGICSPVAYWRSTAASRPGVDRRAAAGPAGVGGRDQTSAHWADDALATTSAASTAWRRCSVRGWRWSSMRMTARHASSTARRSTSGGRTRRRWSYCYVPPASPWLRDLRRLRPTGGQLAAGDGPVGSSGLGKRVTGATPPGERTLNLNLKGQASQPETGRPPKKKRHTLQPRTGPR